MKIQLNLIIRLLVTTCLFIGCNNKNPKQNSNTGSTSFDSLSTTLVNVDGRTSNMHFNLSMDTMVGNRLYNVNNAANCNAASLIAINSHLKGLLHFFLLNSNNTDNSEDVIIKVEMMVYSFDLSPVDFQHCDKQAPGNPPTKKITVKADATWTGNFMGFSQDRCCATKSKISFSNFTVTGLAALDNWILDKVKKDLLVEFDSQIAHALCEKMNSGQRLPAGDSGRCNGWMEMP